MGFFSSKPKVTIGEFCRDHYDRLVFPPPRQAFDMAAVYWKTAFASVAEADPRFLGATNTHFAHEMTVLRLEIIGLAFLHSGPIDLVPAQSVFTWEYLRDTNRAAFWDEMEDYNAAVAQSCFHGYDKQTAAGRMRITFVNSLRVNFFEKWHNTGLNPKGANGNFDDAEVADAKCLARSANRMGTSASWDDSVLPSYLRATLVNRLGIDDVNPEARFRLQAAMFGLYEGARQAIGAVKMTT